MSNDLTIKVTQSGFEVESLFFYELDLNSLEVRVIQLGNRIFNHATYGELEKLGKKARAVGIQEFIEQTGRKFHLQKICYMSLPVSTVAPNYSFEKDFHGLRSFGSQQMTDCFRREEMSLLWDVPPAEWTLDTLAESLNHDTFKNILKEYIGQLTSADLTLMFVMFSRDSKDPARKLYLEKLRQHFTNRLLTYSKCPAGFAESLGLPFPEGVGGIVHQYYCGFEKITLGNNFGCRRFKTRKALDPTICGSQKDTYFIR